MLGYFNVTVVALYLYAYHVEKDPAKSRHMWIKYFVCAKKTCPHIGTSHPRTTYPRYRWCGAAA